MVGDSGRTPGGGGTFLVPAEGGGSIFLGYFFWVNFLIPFLGYPGPPPGGVHPTLLGRRWALPLPLHDYYYFYISILPSLCRGFLVPGVLPRSAVSRIALLHPSAKPHQGLVARSLFVELSVLPQSLFLKHRPEYFPPHNHAQHN